MLDFFLYHTPFYYLIQSFWRDEAFSYFLSKPSIFQIISYTSHDFNPPLYYILLHFWIGLVGRWDEGLRILSFIFHIGSVFVSGLIAEKTMKKYMRWVLPLFVFLNPLLLYYAFELRMYSLYAFFTFLCIYFFLQKDWKKYIITGALGLYTHSYFILFIGSIFLVNIIRIKFNSKNKLKFKELILPLVPICFFLPWVPVLLKQFMASTGSWLYPVDAQLIKSSLGNLFSNYDGTPWFGWEYTKYLSLVIILFFAYGIFRKSKNIILYATSVFFPLSFIIIYSLLRQPLYVNRYLIFITICILLGLMSAISSVNNKIIRSLLIALWLGLSIFINIYMPPYKKKTDFKSSMTEINSYASKDDYAYGKTPISMLETAYYFNNQDKIYLYNPTHEIIPNYIGVTVVFPTLVRDDFPRAPSRTFLVDDDASYEIIIRK